MNAYFRRLKPRLTFLLALGLTSSLIFLAWQREWIIIQLPSLNTPPPAPHSADKRPVTLFFSSHERWVQEKVEVIWSETDTTQTIKYLVDRWLTLVDEERFTESKVSLQSALMPSAQEVVLSFDRSPFDPESTTITKWLWIESLLKTLRDNSIKIQ